MKQWPPGVPDRLTLSCGVCGNRPFFCYRVTDECWNRIAPAEHRLRVLCLGCFDELATKAGVDILPHLEDVNFTGVRKTLKLLPAEAYYFPEGQPWYVRRYR